MLRSLLIATSSLAFAACTALSNEPVTFQFEEPRVTCTQALRASGMALRKLGYTVEDVVPAIEGEPGRVTAVRQTGWTAADPRAGERLEASIELSCDDAGASLAGVAAGSAGDRLRFPGEFESAFREALAAQHPGARGKGVRPRAIPEKGLSVRLIPLRPEDEVPWAPGAAAGVGLVAVRVEIRNRTERAYRFDPEAIRMTTVDGERRRPLSRAEVLDRCAGVPELGPRLVGAAAHAALIAAGERHDGFVYVDAATYRRATATLTDVDSDEDEGFSVRY